MRELAAGLVLVVSLSLVPAMPAAAEEYVCRETVGAVTLDNVKVPDGRRCVLEGTYVKGTIKVETDATLLAKDVRVVGNVQAEDAANVVVKAGSRIGGSVQVVQGGKASVIRSRINGDILYDDNSRALSAIRNKIGGNLQSFQNTGGVEIRRNRIDGNLQCKENRLPRRAATTSSRAARKSSASGSERPSGGPSFGRSADSDGLERDRRDDA